MVLQVIKLSNPFTDNYSWLKQASKILGRLLRDVNVREQVFAITVFGCADQDILAIVGDSGVKHPLWLGIVLVDQDIVLLFCANSVVEYLLILQFVGFSSCLLH